MSDKRGGWDLTSPHSLESACEWIRSGSKALFVIAVRAGAKPDDDGRFTVESAIAVDPEMPIKDIPARLELETAALVAAVVNRRDLRGKKNARISHSQQSKR